MLEHSNSDPDKALSCVFCRRWTLNPAILYRLFTSPGAAASAAFAGLLPVGHSVLFCRGRSIVRSLLVPQSR